MKADLKNGFRQFGTHPKDWKYQVYCNGEDEHYIDLACPFGKTNSPLEFCPPVALFAKSVVAKFKEKDTTYHPVLGTYMDDIFGGLAHDHSYERAMLFRKYICETGASLTIRFNMKETKTPLPSTKQVILGCLYDAINRRIRTAEKKREKYFTRILHVMASRTTSVKEMQQLHGNLNFAAQTAPYGRPFLAHLSNDISEA